MGVLGWNRLLAKEEWLPDYTSRNGYNANNARFASLWRDRNVSLERTESIPIDADLHIDGYGLSFFLQRVAYARHIELVIAKSNSQKKGKKTNGATIKISSLKPSQVRELLPSFCPLSLLHNVTKEFIDSITGSGDDAGTTQNANRPRRNVTFYWDGEARYVFKQATDIGRQSTIASEWSNFHQYCLYGRMPATETIHNWDSQFPRSRLFVSQILHTIQHHACRPTMIFCEEEADHIIARAASGKPNDYILGNDSDFCFFPKTNYIPFSTLDGSSKGHLAGIVIRRDTIAEHLNLPDEAALVELAILMGNDYIDPVHASLDDVDDLIISGYTEDRMVDYPDLIAFLKHKGRGYRITSISEDTEEVLHFIRTLYNLGDFKDFDYAKVTKQEEEDYDEDDHNSEVLVTNMNTSDSIPSDSIRPELPDEVNLDLAKIQPLLDSSVKDATIRCLQAYLEHMKTYCQTDKQMMTMEHLEVFRKMPMITSEAMVSNFILQNPLWRPKWEDVLAAYLVEKVISESFLRNPASPIARLSPPFSIFDQHSFHVMLHALRQSQTLEDHVTTSNEIGDKTPLPSSEVPEYTPLPVDEFEETILGSVKRNRVTIIQGQTGCGKSTRIPLMLLKAPPPDDTVDTVKLFISQPRRIAAKALVEHLRNVEPTLRDQIALRMGHGVKEYETSSTRAWFVTTGYLVRLMANHPERFDHITYLIIDEVHERSVDTDILCLLCRRMLQTNTRLRLLLMSATLAAALYQDYFQVPEPPIKVGARRFPVEEIYLEDIGSKIELPRKEKIMIDSMIEECRRMKCIISPSTSYMEKLYKLVSYLATVVGRPGSSVLIFVSGMNDIIQITELIEQLYVPGVKFTCLPVHSDIPFEDQMMVFVPPAADEVKIIIATNAAESSVTLPDVDHVICLGICKQILYNEMSHRQMLVPTWISRASAEQRKGRTGRLRPGTVYRMYTAASFNHHMAEFEPGEIARIPLDSVILMLKTMLPGENATEVLLNCLEPPDTKNIQRSFESLHQSHFISSPDDDCNITTLGSFVSALGIDLALGSFIGLGIQLGVGAEAIQIAAILSFPKPPWVMSNPLIHEPKDYNDSIAKTYVSRCHFDANLYSEPLAVMNLLWEYECAHDKTKWCWFYGVFPPRIRRLKTTYENLQSRVAAFVGIDSRLLKVESPPLYMAHAKVNILRIMQVWVFNDTMIEFQPKKSLKECTSENDFTLLLGPKSAQVDESHLKQVLKSERHPFRLEAYSEVQQKGSFFSAPGIGFGLPDFPTGSDFESRILSYASENDFVLMWIVFLDYSVIYVRDDLSRVSGFDSMMSKLTTRIATSNLVAKKYSGKNARGLRERACGRWVIDQNKDAQDKSQLVWEKIEILDEKEKRKKGQKKIDLQLSQFCKAHSVRAFSLNFGWETNCMESKRSFLIVSRSPLAEKVTDLDLRDILASSAVQSSTSKSIGQQKLIFPKTPSQPLEFASSKSNSRNPPLTSWDRPPIICIPEGARLVSVVASGRRSEHILRLSNCIDDLDDTESNELLDVYLDPLQTKISDRWNRLDSKKKVYVETNSVPASAVPVNGSDTLYCTCANTLEVKGGGLKAEGLTLLPPGKAFYFLCRMTFGLLQIFDGNFDAFLDESVSWLGSSSIPHDDDIEKFKTRVRNARAFHLSSIELGEKLECFPNKIKELLAIFDGVDGYESTVWENLYSNPFIPGNRKKIFVSDIASEAFDSKTCTVENEPRSRREAKDKKSSKKKVKSKNSPGFDIEQLKPKPVESVMIKKQETEKSDSTNADYRSLEKLTTYDAEILELSERLLAIAVSPGQQIRQIDFPSTNICALVVQTVRCKIAGDGVCKPMNLKDMEWEIFKCNLLGQNWYHARFLNRGLPYLRKKSKKLPQWVRNKTRPNNIIDAIACIPPSVSEIVVNQMTKVSIEDEDILLFRSIDIAMKMEAAFWLERQYVTIDRHWYQQHNIETMITRLLDEHKYAVKRKNFN